jgi:hypothetical protein
MLVCSPLSLHFEKSSAVRVKMRISFSFCSEIEGFMIFLSVLLPEQPVMVLLLERDLIS